MHIILGRGETHEIGTEKTPAWLINIIPQLVPHSSSGVQAEWHYNGKIIEVSVDTTGLLSAFVDQDGNYDVGVENVSDFSEGTIQQIMLHLHNLGQSFRQLGE